MIPRIKVRDDIQKALLASGVVAAGAAGFGKGRKTGSSETKTELVGKFKDYNQKENKMIARKYYSMGKQAELEAIAEDAFMDELQKIASKGDLFADTARQLSTNTKSYWRNTRRMGKGMGKAIQDGNGEDFARNIHRFGGKSALEAAPLGIAGVSLAAINAASKKKDA